MSIPSFDYGGEGLPLHFLHANGYPPACYKPLLELLKTKYHVFGMLLRPLWDGSKPEELDDWHPLSEDLLQFLESTPLPAWEPVIGVGHSIGGIVTLRAALRNPEKFRALVLLDPVLFVPPVLTAWNFARALGLGNKFHPKIASALRRRRIFENFDAAFEGYRSRDVFKNMSDENLRAYIAGVLKTKTDLRALVTGNTKPRKDVSFELAYSPEWEARIYLTAMRDFDIWRDLPKLKIPILIIRGAETDTFLENAADLIQEKNPKVLIKTLDQATHLLPLEHPQRVFNHIRAFLTGI